MGAAAMTLYYEALQRLPLGDMVITDPVLPHMWHWTMYSSCIGSSACSLLPPLPAWCSTKIQSLCCTLLFPGLLTNAYKRLQSCCTCTHLLLCLALQMTLYFIYPAVTCALAWLVHGEAITWLAATGCAISLIGVACIAQPPFLFGGASEQYNMQHWLGGLHSSGLLVSAAALAVQGACVSQCEQYHLHVGQGCISGVFAVGSSSAHFCHPGQQCP